MRSKLVAACIAAALLAGESHAYMDRGYYPNARDVCQLRVQLKAGKRLPIDSQRAMIAKVTPINAGERLHVVAWDEAGGKTYECNCVVGSGDADLYPSVRLAEPPACTVR